ISIDEHVIAERPQILINPFSAFIYGPYIAIEKINLLIGYSYLDEQWIYYTSCSAETKPDIIFKIGNNNYTINPSEYLIKKVLMIVDHEPYDPDPFPGTSTL
ncbi:hypothetical protein A3Q56_03266, partial [Intoshia linei]